jgi:hypothetical protein
MFTDFITFFNNLSSLQTFLFFVGIGIVVFILHTVGCILFNKGLCPIPQPLLGGYWGVAVAPWLIYVAIDYRNHEALIAHEQCHQKQQLRDGTLTFWLKYLTDKQARQDYEIEAYRVWVQVAPNDLSRCVWYLTKSYNFDLTDQQAIDLLK